MEKSGTCVFAEVYLRSIYMDPHNGRPIEEIG